MVPPVPPHYSVREGAGLIGISPDALRKRMAAGAIAHRTIDGVAMVDAAAIERERAELLERLEAVDARDGAPPPPEEVAALRREVERLRSVVDSLIQGSIALQQADRAHIDTLQQLLLPQTVQG